MVKKLIALTLCFLMTFSCAALPVSATASATPQAISETINVPSSTFGSTFIRTIMNIFKGLFRMEPIVTSVDIEDGPQVTLKPAGANATYTVYFYDSAVNGEHINAVNTQVSRNSKPIHIINNFFKLVSQS